MKQETKAKIGIFSLTLLSMSALGISPSLGMIAKSFPNASLSNVQMITAIPSFMALLSAVIVGNVANKVSTKILALFGPIAIFIGGIFPFFFHQYLWFLLVCSGILGIGIGLITNVTPILITKHISGEKRQEVMGQNTSFVSIGAIILTFVGGQLATTGWQNNYLVYILAGVIFICVLFILPYDKKTLQNEMHETEEKSKSNKNPMFIYIIAVLGIFFLCLYNIFPNNVSSLIINDGIGNSATAGIANSIGLLGGLISGLLIGKIIRFFQKYSFAASFAILGISQLILSVGTSLPVIYFTSFLIGFSLSIFMSQAPYLISIKVQPFVFPVAIALFSAGTSIGGFISPLSINGISSLCFSGSVRDNILTGGIIAIIVAIVLLGSGFQKKIMND